MRSPMRQAHPIEPSAQRRCRHPPQQLRQCLLLFALCLLVPTHLLSWQTATAHASEAPVDRGPQSPQAARTIFLVRHAEKLDESPQALLSPMGHARAQRLCDLLSRADVRRVVVSEYQRTQQTAQPIADRLGIKPHVVPARDRAALRELLVSSKAADGAVLVVGHSDTLPQILGDLGLPSEPIAGSDYGNLFVVVLPTNAPASGASKSPGPAIAPTLIRLRY